MPVADGEGVGEDELLALSVGDGLELGDELSVAVELGGQLRDVQAEKARLEEDWLRVAEEAEIT